MRKPGNQPSCIAWRVSENEPVIIAWLAMMVATVEQYQRENRPERGEIEERIADRGWMFEKKSRLSGIVEKERRQHEPVPGGADRVSADMPHIGIERLAPGDRQEDPAENGKAAPPALPQKGDRISRVDRGEHLRMAQDAAYAQHRDHPEPEQHDRSEHAADARRAAALNGKKA